LNLAARSGAHQPFFRRSPRLLARA
jgi:hypothetical protein